MKVSTVTSKLWCIPRKDQIPTQEHSIVTRMSKVLATSSQEDRVSAQVWRKFMEIATITKKEWDLIKKRIVKNPSFSYLLISSSSSWHLMKTPVNTKFRRWHNSLHLKTLTTSKRVNSLRSIRSKSKVLLRTIMTTVGLALSPKLRKEELMAQVMIVWQVNQLNLNQTLLLHRSLTRQQAEAWAEVNNRKR